MTKRSSSRSVITSFSSVAQTHLLPQFRALREFSLHGEEADFVVKQALLARPEVERRFGRVMPRRSLEQNYDVFVSYR